MLARVAWVVQSFVGAYGAKVAGVACALVCNVVEHAILGARAHSRGLVHNHHFTVVV